MIDKIKLFLVKVFVGSKLDKVIAAVRTFSDGKKAYSGGILLLATALNVLVNSLAGVTDISGVIEALKNPEFIKPLGEGLVAIGIRAKLPSK